MPCFVWKSHTAHHYISGKEKEEPLQLLFFSAPQAAHLFKLSRHILGHVTDFVHEGVCSGEVIFSFEGVSDIEEEGEHHCRDVSSHII